MLLQKFRAAIALGVAATITMSCEPAGTLGGSSGRTNDYLVARQALETGNYSLAIQRYERMLSFTGEAAGRIQLEYAHSLLRAGRFDDVIEVSDGLAAAHGGALRASALAIRGTARHQRARAMMAQGQRGAAPRALLQGARADLAEFLNSHPKLDAAGSMAARAQLVDVDLRDAG